ncbi:sigma-70 family RNA polymerase sigma factor [Lapidilactobacillus gannanensis]|jgi:RNA polymerase sporulation-specific sigma factor|uniref:Sigma-70 family RNA polymerase sigma factor n=1 Tax=Lapidilactobacillus gannanensis TaxID=2486002 RepID=A0ABW4BPV5_9LACO|nr:sigma-70 family RNA polymerase sigma factor [Lapidilactobacillus gannanensis]MCH4056546.1 sigma-70 family RNA polymerase sigma factor [Lactobacillaceae bacterium]
MSINQNELLLIKAVQDHSDSQALESLVKKYQPMICRAAQQFYFKLFDQDDWQQEARIVCYETCLLYRTDHNCQFGAFFKLRFHNHLRSLLRHELALKRQSNHQSLPLEDYLAEENSYGSICYPTQLKTQSFFEMEQFLKTLSYFELQSFRVACQQQTLEETCRHLDCTEEQVRRGIDRCHGKMREFIKDKT